MFFKPQKYLLASRFPKKTRWRFPAEGKCFSYLSPKTSTYGKFFSHINRVTLTPALSLTGRGGKRIVPAQEIFPSARRERGKKGIVPAREIFPFSCKDKGKRDLPYPKFLLLPSRDREKGNSPCLKFLLLPTGEKAGMRGGWETSSSPRSWLTAALMSNHLPFERLLTRRERFR